MWKFNLIKNVNTALRKTDKCGLDYHKVYNRPGTAESRIKNYCTYQNQTLRSILIDISYHMTQTLQGYEGIVISKILDLITEYIVYLGWAADPITIFDCLNHKNCSRVIAIQSTPVSMRNNNGLIIHHIESQRPSSEYATISAHQPNELIYTNNLFFFFGHDRTVDEICDQNEYFPHDRYWYDPDYWSTNLQTEKIAINYTVERQNVWQTALVPYGLKYEEITGPVCSYDCLLKKVTQLAADMQINADMKINADMQINTKYYKYLLNNDYQNQIAQDFVHYQLTHDININFNYFPVVLISLIGKYIRLFDAEFDRKCYIWLKHKCDASLMFDDTGYVSTDPPYDPNEVYEPGFVYWTDEVIFCRSR